MSVNILTEDTLARLSGFVEKRMGLHFPREKWSDLDKGVLLACREAEGGAPEAFADRLLTGLATREHLEMLAAELTVGETYFFREPKAFDAFRDLVLPDIIGRNKDGERRLKIWSAACSTGEEPYTAAMILKDALPDGAGWKHTLLATDINVRSLKKAAAGVYSKWSFRGVPDEIRERHFEKKDGGRFELHGGIKDMVTFSTLNLIEDGYPSVLNNTNAMDVIFCRNVLMYFSREDIKNTARKLYRSLREGGWLITGQAELVEEYFQDFERVSAGQAVIYRKTSGKKAAARAVFPAPPETKKPAGSAMPPAAVARPRPAAPLPAARPLPAERDAYKEAEALYGQGRYEEAGKALEELPPARRGEAAALALLARIRANQGRLADAALSCRKAIAADDLNPLYYYLLSAVLTEQGLPAEAADALRKVIYLDPGFVPAHYALGNLAARQGKRAEADRHFGRALLLLGKMSPGAPLPESGGLTAARLAAMIELAKKKEA